MGAPGCAAALGLALLLLPAAVAATLTAVLDSPTPARAPDQVEGIDPVLLDAYTRGAQHAHHAEAEEPCTGMRWSILAGIGAVESDHAAATTITPEGDTHPPITGPRLDGSGAGGNTTPHPDTDGGDLDGDTEYDRAVGPLQFLPATWNAHGIDATGTGRADPHNVYDAAATAAAYLCTTSTEPLDFTDRDHLAQALHRYNPATWYVDQVMAEIEHYDTLPAEPPAEGGSDTGQQAVAWALDQLGKPYAWGGTGPHTFDCSGLTMRAWQEAGVDIPRVTTDQFTHGTRIPLEEIQPGDLLFYNRGPDPQPGHVTMYIGNGEMINAPSTGEVVRIDPITMDYYAQAFAGAVRPG